MEKSLPNRAGRCGDLFRVQQRTECLVLPSRHTRRTSSPRTGRTGKVTKERKTQEWWYRLGEKLKLHTNADSYLDFQTWNRTRGTPICNLLPLQHRHVQKTTHFQKKSPCVSESASFQGDKMKNSGSVIGSWNPEQADKVWAVSSKAQAAPTGAPAASRQSRDLPERTE